MKTLDRYGCPYKFAIDYLIKNEHKLKEYGNNYASQVIKIAIEALEKQIPANLILRNSGVCECPNCKTIYSYIEYCSGCGQKLNINSVR